MDKIALQDIATQLKRIADYMEQHPRQNITIHVNEGATISGGITDIAEYIANRQGIANAGANATSQYIGKDGNNLNNSPDSSEHYNIHGERGTAAKNIDVLDNSARSGGDNARHIISDNAESFNSNDGEAIKNLTSALSLSYNPGTG